MLNASLASCVCCLQEEDEDLGFLFILRNLLNFLWTLFVLELDNLQVFHIDYFQVYPEYSIHFNCESHFFEFYNFGLSNYLPNFHDENELFIINFFVLHYIFKYSFVKHVDSCQEKVNFDILTFTNTLQHYFLDLILKYYFVTHNQLQVVDLRHGRDYPLEVRQYQVIGCLISFRYYHFHSSKILINLQDTC